CVSSSVLVRCVYVLVFFCSKTFAVCVCVCVCVSVCVCVCEREREIERECVCVSETVREGGGRQREKEREKERGEEKTNRIMLSSSHAVCLLWQHRPTAIMLIKPI